ncbi:UPF0481 protein At3g47200 [Linum perenne]
MLSLLERTQNAVSTLDACGKAILRFDSDVRSSYGQWIDYSDTDLARMMLLDGCFILELFLRYSNPDPKLQSDPIFTTSWMILTLQRDLALLENQIPFFVLEWLFNFTVRRTANGLSTPSLPDLALRFFRSSINNVSEETLGGAQGGRDRVRERRDEVSLRFRVQERRVQDPAVESPRLDGLAVQELHRVRAVLSGELAVYNFLRSVDGSVDRHGEGRRSVGAAEDYCQRFGREGGCGGDV